MRRCIIHCGLHKTGSSSIQTFLRHELRDERFYYPASSDKPALLDDCHNRPLCCAFRDHPEEYHIHAKEGVGVRELRARGDWFKQRLRADAAPEKAEALVLSAEELSNYEPSELERLVAFLAEQGLEVEAIGYVRKYKQLQESRFQQSLREAVPGGAVPPPESFRYASFAYRDKVERIAQAVARGSLQLGIFEVAVSSAGGVVDDFRRRAGIVQHSQPLVRQNEGLSMDAVRLLYALQKMHPERGVGTDAIAAHGLLIEKMSALKGERVAFHSSLLRRSEHHWRPDVDWISHQVGEDMLGDLHADDERDCVRCEADVFAFSPRSLEWLASESQTAFASLKSGEPGVVAEAMRVLRDRLCAEAGRGRWLRDGWLSRLIRTGGGKG